MAKECSLSTGKLPPVTNGPREEAVLVEFTGGLLRNRVARITGRLDMNSAVYHGRKATNKTVKIQYLYEDFKDTVCV